MVQYHKPVKSKRSGSGGKRRSMTDKRLSQYGGFFGRTRVAKEGGKEVRKSFKVIGGGRKTVAKYVLFANISTPQGVKKAKIMTVTECSANRHYARENVVVKGSIIKTDLGDARVTSRPGQDGVVNAVLLQKKA
ncbi:30S ribosomal protein S8e [Candidatus Norongarragalina meridionalis]|nr:30S ribosomal protein S8e [Candidatus Norongarragalina meridionalis]